MPTLAGTKLDKYDMLEEVGHGGMAVVYRGRDRVLEREVAVKVLHPHLADREESRQRLRREAIAVAKLRHENILEIFDYSGPEAGESYIVTEFIHGPTLRDWMEGDHEPRPAIAAMIVHRLSLALSCAHRGGIVHRDIKPENVMIRQEDGCIKLMDFGIAQILDNQKLTMTGQLIGSPAYMAPELISGRPLDARTDLFSLGILLYQLATGELPFAGRNPHEVLNRIADGNYAPPSTVYPLVDLDMEGIIARALANNPDERFQSAETLARDLEDYLAEMSLEPTPAELCRYFQNPTEYVRELDERVSTALMAQAETAAREGMHGRAIRLLGRVLELDKDHKAARALLVRLRVRERRMRQLLFGGATLGLVGLIGAGIVLVPPGASSDERPRAVLESDDPTPVHEGMHARVPEADVPLDPSTRKSTMVDPADPTAAEPATGPAADDPDTTGGEPRVKPTTKEGKTVQRTPTPDAVRCVVQIANVNSSTARNLDVRVGKDTVDVDAKGRVEFQLAGPQIDLDVRSPRFSGHRVVTRADCGKPGLALEVVPQNAKMSFTGPPGMIVICKRGCPSTAPFKADSAPEIDLDDDEPNREVTLRFQAVGFEDETKDYTLLPGPNPISVELEARPGSG